MSTSLPSWAEAAVNLPNRATEMSYASRSQLPQENERNKSQPLGQSQNKERMQPIGLSTQNQNEQYDLNNSRSSYNRMNISENHGYGRNDIRPGREVQSIFDEFKYREVCINSSRKAKLVASFLTKIKDHIHKEACLEAEVIGAFCFLMFHRICLG